MTRSLIFAALVTGQASLALFCRLGAPQNALERLITAAIPPYYDHRLQGKMTGLTGHLQQSTDRVAYLLPSGEDRL
ncbi:MAG TPA: hypothetical protein VGM62_17895 [Chthoniobacterales bacterium]|jgi:hypothetical protein